MAKSTARYVCQSCAAVHAKWGGRCEACGAWNSIVEEVQPAAQARTVAAGRRIALVGLEGEATKIRTRLSGHNAPQIGAEVWLGVEGAVMAYPRSQPIANAPQVSRPAEEYAAAIPEEDK